MKKDRSYSHHDEGHDNDDDDDDTKKNNQGQRKYQSTNNNNNSRQQHQDRMMKSNKTLQADAKFIDQLTQDPYHNSSSIGSTTGGGGGMRGSTGGTNSSSIMNINTESDVSNTALSVSAQTAYQTLHRTNVFKIRVEQLLDETMLGSGTTGGKKKQQQQQHSNVSTTNTSQTTDTGLFVIDTTTAFKKDHDDDDDTTTTKNKKTWYPLVEKYTYLLEQLLGTLPGTTLTTTNQYHDKNKNNNNNLKIKLKQQQPQSQQSLSFVQLQPNCPFDIYADRAVTVTIPNPKAIVDKMKNSQKNKVSSCDESVLRIYDTYRHSHHHASIFYQLGYSTTSSSTKGSHTYHADDIVPTMERTILLPSSFFSDPTTITTSNIHGVKNETDHDSNKTTTTNHNNKKDYLRHRYTDKRNLIVWYIGQYFSKPEFQHLIGQVYYQYWKGDIRKPVLLFVPPSSTTTTSVQQPEDVVETNNNNKNRKRSKKDSKESTVIKIEDDDDNNNQNHNNMIMKQVLKQLTPLPSTKKVRFRILLHFQMESIDWIPRLRLVPNRCNIVTTTTTTKNPTAVSTVSPPITDLDSSCYYNNNILLEDAKHLWYETAAGRKSVTTTSMMKGGDDDDDDEQHRHHNHHSLDSQNYYDIDYDESWYRNWNRTLLLIKIWCQQRGFIGGHDTLDESIIAVQLLYLFRTKLANPVKMIPTQIITIWFKYISETNWLGTNTSTQQVDGEPGASTNSSDQQQRRTTKNPIRSTQHRSIVVLPYPGMNEKQTIALSTLGKLYAEQAKNSPLGLNDPLTLLELYQVTTPECTGPVFLDPTLTYNYTGRLSPSYTRVLQREAKKSLQAIHVTPVMSVKQQQLQHRNVQDPFQYLFRTEARFWNRYDMYVRLDLDQLQIPTTLFSSYHVDDMGEYECISRGLVRVLNQALGDRVRALRPLTTGNGSATTTSVKNKSNNAVESVGMEVGVTDSNEIPTYPLRGDQKTSGQHQQPNPVMGSSRHVVLGVTINPDTCYRLVDRGPPADHVTKVQSFLELWGREKAELRRFKDGAIVHAVVWDTVENNHINKNNNNQNDDYIQFQNDDKWQGGIVERIIQHIVKLHFTKKIPDDSKKKTSKKLLASTTENDNTSSIIPKSQVTEFALRNMNSIVDGVASQPGKDIEKTMRHTILANPLAVNRMAIRAFEQLSTFLRTNSTPTIPIPDSTTGLKKSVLELPLVIDAVEPLSPSLRYAELYPPIPHPLLGCTAIPGIKKVAGAIQSQPIAIQIRFGSTSKWPTDLKAIGAAKTAMLITLMNGIDRLKAEKRSDTAGFQGEPVVTSGYADIGYMGFVFRIFVRADPELHVLRSIRNPTPEAATLLRALTKQTVVAATHHTIVHAVYTSHPSSSATVRMARRWIAAHLLSDHIPFEALELMVAYVYTTTASPLDPPGTVTSGFQRFLSLLAYHDWKHEPLVVDPQGYFSDSDYEAINTKFEQIRGPSYTLGPPMFIVSPSSRPGGKDVEGNEETIVHPGGAGIWTPIFTSSRPEHVVLNRTVALAERTYLYLRKVQTEFVPNAWCAAFQESTSAFRSYSVLLRVDPAFLVDEHSSSDATGLEVSIDSKDEQLESSYSRSMFRQLEGPKELRRKMYRNLLGQDQTSILLEWRPIPSVLNTLRQKLGSMALFFYNDLCPDVIAVVWRRPLLQPKAFSAMTAEYVHPVTADDWQVDTLVTLNMGDILREIVQYTTDIVIDLKIFDGGLTIQPPTKRKRSKEITNSPEESEAEPTSSDSDSD